MRDTGNTVYVGPDEGLVVRMPEGYLLTRKISSEHTGGAYSLFEATLGLEGGSQPHIQHREDECFYVLEGRFQFVIEDSKIEVGIGSLIYVSKGTLHAFKNVGQWTGRLLVSQTPGGSYEGFIEEVGNQATEKVGSPTAEEPREADRIREIGMKYGVEMVLPVPWRDRRSAEDGKKKPGKEGEAR